MAVISGNDVLIQAGLYGAADDATVAPLPDGGWVIVWNAADWGGSSAGVFQKIYDPDGRERVYTQPDGTPRVLNPRVNAGPQPDLDHPAVTVLSDGGWVVSWVSAATPTYPGDNAPAIYQRVFTADGIPVNGFDSQVARFAENGTGSGMQQVTALRDGGYVVTWTTYDSASGGATMIQQTFTASGGPNAAPLAIPLPASARPVDPHVTALESGGWVVAWCETTERDGSSSGIYQQAFSSSGATLGGNVLVNTGTLSGQHTPIITALADGGWVVGWVSQFPMRSDTTLHQQAYFADGSTRGNEALLTDRTSSEAHVTALADGGWVTSWIAQGTGGSGADIYQRVFGANGQPVGEIARVNTRTTGQEFNHAITALPDGGWVVVWCATGPADADNGIFQQAFRRDATPYGQQMQVASRLPADGDLPEISTLADGWIVVWDALDDDGTGGVRETTHQRQFQYDDTPSITSNGGGPLAAVSVVENRTKIITAQASDPDGTQIIWSIVGGSDEGLFKINAAKGLLSFRKAADFENPGDRDGDNIYEVVIRASDGSGLADLQTLQIAVTNAKGKTITGTKADDSLRGTTEEDVINGGRGNDDINGKDGHDLLRGGDGKDTILGEAGNDRIEGGKGNDALDGGGGNDILRGDAGNDFILGRAGNDRLYGGSGNDFLNGGAGIDMLWGGTGADVFFLEISKKLRGQAETIDQINDFERGSDKIDLSGLSWVADTDRLDFRYVSIYIPNDLNGVTISTGIRVFYDDIALVDVHASALSDSDFLI